MKCNPKDCKIVNGLCLTHGYSVSETVKCEDYNDPRTNPKRKIERIHQWVNVMYGPKV